MITAISNCRSCKGTEFTSVINLGEQYVVDFPFHKDESLLKAPLHLVKCSNCQLVQLEHSVSPDRLFKKFWYRSGISETMRNALEDIVINAVTYATPDINDSVLDIGSNDGTLLSMYKEVWKFRVRTVGVEPCAELGSESVLSNKVHTVIPTFFSKDAVAHKAPFKIITAIAMFYDVEDPKKFLEDCRDVLLDDGLIIIQMNYLKLMMENTTIDNISHEHLTYWSLTAFAKIADSVGLEVINAEENDVNGGSIRLYLVKKGVQLKGLTRLSEKLHSTLKNNAAELLVREIHKGYDSGSYIYEAFGATAKAKMQGVRDYILAEKAKGAKWYIYGASTRGTALLQVLGLPEGTFLGAAERDKNKFGHVMVSGWIPIYDEDKCRQDATHFLVLPYHFKNQIINRESSWLAKGGKLVFALPEPVVVGDDSVISIAYKHYSQVG